jgi:glutamine synthetase
VGFPLAVLNSAVADVFKDVNKELKIHLDAGKSVKDSLLAITKKWIKNSFKVVFNGNGYAQEWVEEAEKRGLPNLRNTPVALQYLLDGKATAFLQEQNVLSDRELKTRYNVLTEQYSTCREIEFSVQLELISQYVIPTTIDYKNELANSIFAQDRVGVDTTVEREILNQVTTKLIGLKNNYDQVQSQMNDLSESMSERSQKIASDILPQSLELAQICNELEVLLPDDHWPIPKFHELLFIR